VLQTKPLGKNFPAELTMYTKAFEPRAIPKMLSCNLAAGGQGSLTASSSTASRKRGRTC
jgi:hypothetical protein